MRIFIILLLAVAFVCSIPVGRIRDSASEAERQFVERLRRAIPYGGYSVFGGPSGEGSTWAGGEISLHLLALL